jgi:hypothetical protein
MHISRRDACLGVLGAALAASVQPLGEANAREIEVGALYPTAPDPSYVIFKPTPNQTPALRAGNLSPYQFWIPPSWKEARVANILSGNYCQPKCAEPWVEAKFESPKQGAIQVIISPLVRLTNRPGASIESIGSADDIITSLGQFVTGNSIEPDEIVEVNSKTKDDRTYYSYTVDSPYAKNGTHNLAVATAKDNAVYLFVVSASDKQWAANENVLRTIQESFSV